MCSMRAEHARLDEIGNRAVLTQPATAPVSVPVLFAAQVARAPEAVAMSFGGWSWTYRELEEAANRLAHLLAAQGVGPGQCVALLLERSAQAIVAMLAVLKTGAAYLAIDPALPAARIGFMLGDAAPIAAITTAGLPCGWTGTICWSSISTTPRSTTCQCTALPAPAADGIAYLIYTSGTTGLPKGVLVTHPLTQPGGGDSPAPGDGAGVVAVSLSFDVSMSEIWHALLGGGRLVVVPRRWRANRSTHTADQCEITMLTQTPSAVATSDRRDWSRQLLLGGEACPPRWWIGGRRAGGDQRLRTHRDHGVCVDECAAVSRGRVVRSVRRYRRGVVRAGWVVAAVPAGVVGELYVAGRRVAWDWRRAG